MLAAVTKAMFEDSAQTFVRFRKSPPPITPRHVRHAVRNPLSSDGKMITGRILWMESPSRLLTTLHQRILRCAVPLLSMRQQRKKPSDSERCWFSDTSGMALMKNELCLFQFFPLKSVWLTSSNSQGFCSPPCNNK